MSCFGVFVLGLTAVATLHLTNGQAIWGTGGNHWNGHGSQLSGLGNHWSGFDSQLGVHGNHWSRHGNPWHPWNGHSIGDRENKASTAVCTAFSRGPRRKGEGKGGGGKGGGDKGGGDKGRGGKGGKGRPPPRIFFQATIKETFNKWRKSGLEIQVELNSPIPFEELSLVLTKFGAANNFDGCTVDNLGNVVTGSKRHHFQSNSDGVIGTFTDVRKNEDRIETFKDLPISTLEEAFGCGLALCTEVRRVSDDSDDKDGWGWNLGWNTPKNPDKYVCEEPIPICCTLGKSDSNSDGRPPKGDTGTRGL